MCFASALLLSTHINFRVEVMCDVVQRSGVCLVVS